ncbi:MAG: peptide ABC transporter substrate-binding protein [Sarcina sp.]
MRKRGIIAVAIIAVLGIGGYIFYGMTDSGVTEESKNTLDLTTGAIKTLDSVKSSDSQSFNIIQNTQENLLVYDNNKLAPGAASSYDVSSDNTTYTFHLRPGMKWSDGKPLTSEDFKYAWLRLLDRKVAAPYSFFLFGVKNGEAYFQGKVSKDQVAIQTPNPETLVVTLEKPIPYFAQLVASPALAPEREDIVNQFGDKYGTTPQNTVYSGPFTVESWQKGSKIVLKKNPEYWNANNIKLDKVVFSEIKEASTSYQMFLNNQLDVIGGTGDYIMKLKEGATAGKWNEITDVAPSVFYNQYNLESKLLSNPKIRLALSIAMNREDLTSIIQKRNIPAYGLVPDGIVVGNLDYRKQVPQPLKAVMNQDPKALFIEGLKELNLDADPSKYTLKYLLQSSDTRSKTLGEFSQDVWSKKIGVNIQLVTSADFADFLNKLDRGEFDIASSGWGADYNDPMTFLDLFTPQNASNYGKYDDPKVNELVKSLGNISNDEERLKIYSQIEKIEVVDNPAVSPTYYSDVYVFMNKKVKGLQMPKFGGTYQLRWTSIEDNQK